MKDFDKMVGIGVIIWIVVPIILLSLIAFLEEMPQQIEHSQSARADLVYEKKRLGVAVCLVENGQHVTSGGLLWGETKFDQKGLPPAVTINSWTRRPLDNALVLDVTFVGAFTLSGGNVLGGDGEILFLRHAHE